MIQLYYYRAQVDRVVDGDTVDVTIDLGFNVFRRDRLRLSRIDAPEIRGVTREKGLAAKEWLTQRLAGPEQVIVRTQRDSQDKYGRYLADLYCGETCINDSMVSFGHAIYREY